MVNINSIMEYSLVLVAAYLLFFTDSPFLLTLPIIVCFVFFKWLHRYDEKHKLQIPSYIYTMGLLALYANIFGEFFFKFYYWVMHYDKALHLLVSFYLVFAVNAFLKKDVVLKYIFIVLIILGLGALFELFEFGTDLVLGTPLMQGVMINFHEMQGNLMDTMMDLICALIGSLLGILTLRIVDS